MVARHETVVGVFQHRLSDFSLLPVFEKDALEELCFCISFGVALLSLQHPLGILLRPFLWIAIILDPRFLRSSLLVGLVLWLWLVQVRLIASSLVWVLVWILIRIQFHKFSKREEVCLIDYSTLILKVSLTLKFS